MTGYRVPLDLASNDSSSVSGGSSVAGQNIEDIVQEEPMYYVLGQFLTSSTSGKNIADILQELCEEVRALRVATMAAAQTMAIAQPAPAPASAPDA